VTAPLQAAGAERPEGFRRVAQALAHAGHAHAPRWLEVPARTAQEAAQALGVSVGQIAKSVVFRRLAAPGAAPGDDDLAVLVVTSGDRRVDEVRVAAIAGALGRADAGFVKARSGFSIGGVAPLAHAVPPLTLLDRDLLRFDLLWAAAGHPNGVFALAPQDLPRLTGGSFADVVHPVDVASEAAR
jgi:prolyl-tRNA editing enzyme YbaK/EbsC (Cys-tRNA(Pro) deacylase)